MGWVETMTEFIRSRKRVKDFGEVFTSPEIIKDMLALIDDSIWKDITKCTTLEPACGDGNFLVEIVKKKLSLGLTPLEAVTTTFGVDICSSNIARARQRLLETVFKRLKSDEEFKEIVCAIHYCVFVVYDTLGRNPNVLEMLEEIPVFNIEKYKDEIDNWQRNVDFDFEKELGDNSIKKRQTEQSILPFAQ